MTRSSSAGIDLDDAVERVVLHGRQLLVVPHEGEAAAETKGGQRLVGTGLVRLVEDDDVEVHVGDAGRGRGRAGGEVAVRLEEARVVLVVAAEAVDRRMHPLGARDAHRAHPGCPREPLEGVVDGEVAVRGHQDPLVGIEGQAALDGLDDHRCLAGPRRTLDEDRLSCGEPAQQVDGPVLGFVGDHPGREPGALLVRLVLGGDDRLRAHEQLGEQTDAEVLGGDGREDRPLRLIERLVERRRDVALGPGVLEAARDDLDDVALMVDARHSPDEVGLVVRLDEHRRVRGQIDGLAEGDLELDLADLGGLPVRVGELPPARRAALAFGTPERPAGPAAEVLAGAVEPGPLRLGALLLGALEAVDQLESCVQLSRPRRVLRRDAPVEQPEGVADDTVRLGDDRFTSGDREELCALGLPSGGPDRDNSKAEMLARAVGPGLWDALEHEVGKVEAQLRRVLVPERDRDVADFTDALGKDGARVGAGVRAVRPCFKDDHGIAAVGHDQVQTIEREVWGYQRTVNLGRGGGPVHRRNDWTSGRLPALLFDAGRRSNRRQPRGGPKAPVCK